MKGHPVILPLSPFLCAEFRAGRAAAQSAARRHQRVQGSGGSTAAGLQRVGGGEHLTSETSVCVETEPGETGHKTQVL